MSAGFDLRTLIYAELQPVADELAIELKATIEERMPVDTGFAQGHVEVEVFRTDFGDLDLEVHDEADYVEYLNQGSSPQAPAGFIEQSIDDAVDIVAARLSTRNVEI